GSMYQNNRLYILVSKKIRINNIYISIKNKREMLSVAFDKRETVFFILTGNSKKCTIAEKSLVMLFSFLKYLQPTHYFKLYKKDGTSIFPEVETLPKEIVAQLKHEKKFISETASQYDLSWQAVNKGYIGNSELYTSFQKIPLIDEYRFIRKYFHPVWVFYVLMLRIFTFKNPVKEIMTFW